MAFCGFVPIVRAYSKDCPVDCQHAFSAKHVVRLDGMLWVTVYVIAGVTWTIDADFYYVQIDATKAIR